MSAAPRSSHPYRVSARWADAPLRAGGPVLQATGWHYCRSLADAQRVRDDIRQHDAHIRATYGAPADHPLRVTIRKR